MRRALALSRFLLAVACCAAFAAVPSIAQSRIALVIGNEDYPAQVGALNKPHEDAEKVAAALERIGFRLSGDGVVKDATREETWDAIERFQVELNAAGEDAIAFFYYSGHGGSHESGGRRTNYLLPAKTTITTARQLPRRGVSLTDLISALGDTSAASIFVVSDACRDTLPLTSNRGGAQPDRGFVPVSARNRMLVAYATADGSTAPDDGVFADALARLLPEQVSADRLFTLVGREVASRRTGGRYPVVSDRLGRDVFLAGVSEARAGPQLDPDAEYWLRITGGPNQFTSCDDYRDYLEAFPDGKFAVRANRLLYTAPCVSLPANASAEVREAETRAIDANRRRALIDNGVLAPRQGISSPSMPEDPAEQGTSKPVPVDKIEFQIAPQPGYPSRALREEIEGTCLVRFNVDVLGQPYDIQADCSEDLFMQPAVRAIDRAKLVPKVIDGQAVERENVSYRIVFQL
ncbi:MAG: caspase family protein [Pseudomonadota bacterium]